MDQKLFEQIASGKPTADLPEPAPLDRSYLKQSDLPGIVALSNEEREADRNTNANPYVQGELEKEIARAKDPKIKAALLSELERQGKSPSAFSPDSLPPTASGAPAKQTDLVSFANQLLSEKRAKVEDRFNKTDTFVPERANGFGADYAKKTSGMDLGKEFGAAIDSYQSNLWAIPAAMGSEYAKQAMLDNKAEAEKQWGSSGAPQSFSEMEFGKNFGDYFAHMAIQSAPYMLEFLATGFGTGALAKNAIAKSAQGVAEKAAAEAVKRGLAKDAATKVGEEAAKQFTGRIYTAAGVVGSYPSAVGDVLSNQYEQAGKFNLPAAAALGVPYAALNAAGLEGIATRAIAGGLPKTALTKEGVAGAIGRGALTGVETGVSEGASETGQEVMNQLGRMAVDPNATLTDERALDAYKESFIAGVMLGGLPGAVAGGFRKPEDAIQEIASQQLQKQQEEAPKPNSPLSNAAVAAQPQDPFAGVLQGFAQRFSDRSFYDKVRQNENLGPDALNEILASYRLVTNPNIEPMQRQAAADRLNQFFSLFDNMPNFTFGRGEQGGSGLPAVQSPASNAVGQADPSVGSIDGEYGRVTDPALLQGQKRLPAPPKKLPTPAPAMLADNRQAQSIVAEYEAAYQDLVKADQLGASDQELMQKQIALRDAEARLSELNAVIEENRIKQSAMKRDELLGRVLASNPQNANRAFDRALKLEGFTDTNFSEDEKAKIARFNELRHAVSNPSADAEQVAPNQGGDFGIKERKSAATSAMQGVADRLNSGWTPLNKFQLVSPTGEIYQMNRGEQAYVSNKLKAKSNATASRTQGSNQASSDLNTGVEGVAGTVQPTSDDGAGAEVVREGSGTSGDSVQQSGAVDDAGAFNGDVNVAEPSQVAQEAPQENGAQNGPEQSAAQGEPRVTEPQDKKRLMLNPEGKVVETEALHDVEYAELPGRIFFTRQQADGLFGIVDTESGAGVYSQAASEEVAISGLREFIVKVGADVVRSKLEQQPKIESKSEFVVAPNGSIDFGEISQEQSKEIKRQSAKIRLERGNGSFGLQHIEERHGAQIRSIGFNTVEDFVFDAVNHIDAIWKPSSTAQLVVVQSVEKGKAVFVELKPSETGDYYTINTAFPVADDYATRKQGWKLLWGGASVPAVSSGDNPLAEQSPSAGATAAMTPGQSSANSVANTQDNRNTDFERGRAMMGEGLDALLSILGGKTNLLPEEEAQIIPVMSKIFRGAALMGYSKFKDAARFVLDTIRAKSPDVADKLDIDNLQAGYINAMKSIADPSTKAEIIAFDSVEQLYAERDEMNKRIEDAEKRTALNPTEAQKESGLYAKGKFPWRGMTISIETPKGAERSGVGEDGQAWSITAPTSYGYFLGTTAADKEHLDVYVGDKPESDRVYVINQTKVDSTAFDEHKVLIGFDSESDAKNAYFGAFSDGFADRVFGSIAGPFSVDEFKSMLPKLEKSKALTDRIAEESDRMVDPLSKVMVTRNVNGADVEQSADVAVKEIDGNMVFAKQLLECLNA